jgi:cyclic beta-1,2-glucan synthetase
MALDELARLLPGATPALCAILSGSRGELEPPIRAEIFGLQRFAQHGRSLGETHRAARAGWGAGATTFFPRLRSNIATLREAHRYISAQALTGYDVSPAAEWLLDNFHLIEAQLKEIHEGLPRRYFRSLPVLLDEPLAGLPRIYGVAWAFVAHTDGAFDEDLLTQFLRAYQETRDLSQSELWALPTTLRVLLIENLRRLAERVAANKAAREAANRCCDAADTCSVTALQPVLALLNRRGVGRMFLTQMALRLHDQPAPPGGAPAPGASEVQAWLHGAVPELALLQAQQSADQAADNLSVSNAVTSLRAIGDADWPDIIGRTSTLTQVMLTSPLFAAEHSTTRDATLHDIERLARRSAHSEAAVARALLALMQADGGTQSATGRAAEPDLEPDLEPGAGRPSDCAACPRRWACATRGRGARWRAGSRCPATWARCCSAPPDWWRGCCCITPPARRARSRRCGSACSPRC